MTSSSPLRDLASGRAPSTQLRVISISSADASSAYADDRSVLMEESGGCFKQPQPYKPSRVGAFLLG